MLLNNENLRLVLTKEIKQEIERQIGILIDKINSQTEIEED